MQMLTTSDIAERSRCSTATVRRWVKQGVNGVKLKTQRVGGRQMTTELWYQEFVAAQNAASKGNIAAMVNAARQAAELLGEGPEDCY